MSEKLAWCAGFFDGEGSTYVNLPTINKNKKGKRSKATPQIVMKVGQENEGPIYKFRNFIKMGHVRGPYKRSCGSKYTWSVESKFDVGDVVKKLWPYLSSIKKQQILNSIDKFIICNQEIKAKKIGVSG